jgi:16S rRNA (adenine1518-N6/adenine1519-N6)-dimethyltransferase
MMIRPKKRLGQHFLRDENIAMQIVGYLNPDCPLVLEIGPGMGVLTKYLLDRRNAAVRDASQCVSTIDPWFMEIDREAAAYLKTKYPEIENRLILGDFLEYDLDKFPPATIVETHRHASIPGPETHRDASLRKNDQRFTVIGNFPYNISSQILFTVLQHRDRIPEVIGMFQKEVAERIAAPPGNRTYGIISVLLQAFYDIEYLMTVHEDVFYPPPKVKSAVIRLRRNATDKLNCDEALFTSVVKTAFNQRRKTLRNALRSMLPSPAEQAASAVLMEYLDLRAERLSVDDFVRLATEISTFA